MCGGRFETSCQTDLERGTTGLKRLHCWGRDLHCPRPPHPTPKHASLPTLEKEIGALFPSVTQRPQRTVTACSVIVDQALNDANECASSRLSRTFQADSSDF